MVESPRVLMREQILKTRKIPVSAVRLFKGKAAPEAS
jgi:hypothetical protein